MHFSCLFGRHQALPSAVRNLGLRVSQCRCCGRDMIHRRGRWTTVPRGFRIVWRRLDEVIAAAVPLKLARNLPAPVRRSENVLHRLANRTADAILFAGAGLRILGWTIADRRRALRGALVEARAPRQLVLPLPAP